MSCKYTIRVKITKIIFGFSKENCSPLTLAVNGNELTNLRLS